LHYFLYTDLPFTQVPHVTIRPFATFHKETELFPQPGTDCFPVLPENLLLFFCQNAKRRPAFLIQSADYPLWNNPPKRLSEQEAMILAQKQNATLYHDSVSNSSYFCYQSETQHMVWIEDGFHLHKKMQFLQKNGIAEVAFPVFSHNTQTILSLVQHPSSK